MPPTVWFNKHLSNTWEILALVRECRGPGEFHLLCTHPRSNYAGRHWSDVFEQEPIGLDDDAYVAYCLDVTRRHAVDLFLPGRKVLPILRARQRFEALGVRVLAAASADNLAVVNDKAKVYAVLAGDSIRLPAYQVVNDLMGFDAAWARLRPGHALLCYKPAVSVYGLGFHIVADRGPALKQLRSGNPFFLSLDDARRTLATKSPFRDLLVMEYLPGPERSVDCLAQDGQLIRCVVRRKEDGGQVLEDNPELVDAVRRLTLRFRLTNLFNVQFRDAAGQAHLLEINPRMSGGLPFACRSGCALPYWALRLALASAAPDDIPPPQTGMWVPQPEPVSSL